MSPVEDFIYQYEEEQRALLLALHQLLVEQLGLEPKIRYKVPFYYKKSWIIYLNPTKQGTVDVSFIRGNELSNEQGLLDSRGRKQVSSIELKSIKKIPENFLEVIQEAILLDEQVKYKSKRK